MLAKQAPTGRPETRRLADWINPTGAKKNIHPINSLIDKVYQKENLSIAWERVKENRAVEVWLVTFRRKIPEAPEAARQRACAAIGMSN